MFEDLDLVPWETLHHAYGPATDFPHLILALLSEREEERNDALFQMDMAYCHQGSVYPATPHTIPFLFRLLQTPGVKGKAGILRQIAQFYQGYTPYGWHRNDEPFEDFGEMTRLAIEKHLSNLQVLLEEDDEEVQAAVLSTLGVMQGSLHTVQSLLMQVLLKSPAGPVRTALWLSALQWALGNTPLLPEFTVQARRDLLNEDADSPQSLAAAMLAFACGERQPEVLQALLQHLGALDTLRESWSGTDDLRDLFLPLLDTDLEFKFRWARHLLLGKTPGMRRNGNVVMRDFLQCSDPAKRAFHDRAVEALIEGLDAEDIWSYRKFIVEDLEKHGAPTEVLVQEYLRWLDLDHAELVASAMEKLSRLQDGRVLPYVDRFLYDPRQKWIDAAAQAILFLGLDASQHFERIRSLVQGEVEMVVLPDIYSTDRSPKTTREFTDIRCLLHFGEKAKTLLPEVLSRCETENIWQAREVLQGWGIEPPELLAGLKKRLKSPDDQTHSQARHWLFQWGYPVDGDILQCFADLSRSENVHHQLEGAVLLHEHSGDSTRLIEVSRSLLEEAARAEDPNEVLVSRAIRHLRKLECFGDHQKTLASTAFLKSRNNPYGNDWILIEVCSWHPDRALILQDVSALVGNWRSLRTLEACVDILQEETLPLLPELIGWRDTLLQDGQSSPENTLRRLEGIIAQLQHIRQGAK